MSSTSDECPIVESPKVAVLSGVAAAVTLFLFAFFRAGPSSAVDEDRGLIISSMNLSFQHVPLTGCSLAVLTLALFPFFFFSTLSTDFFLSSRKKIQKSPVCYKNL